MRERNEQIHWGSLAVTLDADVCEGYGVCVGFDDSIFELDPDEDVVMIKAQPHNSEQFARVDAAVRSCPKRALSFEQQRQPRQL